MPHEFFGQLEQSDVAGLVAALLAKALTSRSVTAGTGLSGGGDLSADRTLAVVYGSAASTAVQGNDTRVTADQAAGTASIRTLGTGAQQAAAGAHSHAAAVVPLPPVDLVDAATIATNASLGHLFRVTITANRALGVPTSPTDGQLAVWEVTASGANRTLTLTTGAGGFAFGSSITGLTATVSGTTDYIRAVYNLTANRWRVLAVAKGY